MNQSNIVSLRIGAAAVAGDVVGIRRDASVIKMDHVIGPILGTDIDATTNSFTVTKHHLVTGDKIKYLKGSGLTVTGLTTTTAYFAIVIDENTFKLATSLANAIAGTVKTFTGAGGDTHTFTHQVAKGKAVGVVVHDVDANETDQPVAVQLFNHGVFTANTKGDTTVEQGDILEVVDSSSLLEAGTTTPKGIALDRLPQNDFAAYDAIAGVYVVGDTCTNGGTNLVCIAANGIGVFSAADWEDLTGAIRVLSL